MKETFKDFYDIIIENLDSYNGEYAAFIDCGPNLFKLLCNLLEEEITLENRRDIAGAIAYYVAPMDVIPEQIYGPYGYIDDIYISSLVLKRLAEEYGYEFIQEVWGNPDINIKEVIDECYVKSLELLEKDDLDAILSYVGIV